MASVTQPGSDSTRMRTPGCLAPGPPWQEYHCRVGAVLSLPWAPTCSLAQSLTALSTPAPSSPDRAQAVTSGPHGVALSLVPAHPLL